MKKILLLAVIMVITAMSANAQVRISSTYPNLDIKIRRCQMTGDRVAIDLLITNTSMKNQSLKLWTHSFDPPEAYAVDDEGTKYTKKNMGFEVDGQVSWSFTGEFAPDIPNKVKLIISDMDTNASEFKIITLLVEDAKSPKRNVITLKNIPISKD